MWNESTSGLWYIVLKIGASLLIATIIIIIVFRSLTFIADGLGFKQKQKEMHLKGIHYGQTYEGSGFRFSNWYSWGSAIKDIDTGVEYEFGGLDSNTASLRALFNSQANSKLKVPQKSNGTTGVYQVTYLPNSGIILNAKLISTPGDR